MCGIAGVVAAPGTGGPWIRPAAARMGEALDHRGPDDSGVWTGAENELALAHARLAVLDRAGGAQPMGAHGCWVVFNGEIYNHHGLRTRLEGRGHRFRSRSDTEVLLRAYLEWGPGVVDRLDGMFAFGLWDASSRQLWLGRDRAGKKPLFYARTADAFWFASEIKALLAGGVPARPSAGALPLYLTYGYVPTPGTFYEGIRHIPPGTLAAVDVRPGAPALNYTERRYWQLRFQGEDMGRDEVVDGVRRRFQEAVERRLESDVPLGAFLSGGIDSTLVVGMMSRLTDRPVQTFSIGFDDDARFDETRYARLAAEAFGTEHTEFRIRGEPIELLDELVRAHDQPFGDSSAIPTHIVSRLTRSRVTVALTGDGGDELFAGYLRLYWGAAAERIPGWACRGAARAASFMPGSQDVRSLPNRARRFLGAAALPMEKRLLQWIGIFPGSLEGLVRPAVLAQADEDRRLEPFRTALERARGGSPLDRALQLNFDTYLLDDLLPKIDRCAMANSLELRSPFLDTALMSFAARIPDRYRAPRGSLKWALRRSFKDLLPAPILNRGKMGFGVPLGTWFRNGWRPVLEERVLGADSPLWDWMEPDPVRALVRDHLSGTVDHGHRLWSLLTLDRWLRLQSPSIERVETHV